MARQYSGRAPHISKVFALDPFGCRGYIRGRMVSTVRTFIAIPVSEETQKALGRLAEEGKRAGGDVKWVDPARIHLTLRFLGDVEEARIPTVVDALGRAGGAAVPFELRVAGVGAFPNLRRPRVIWAGAEERGSVLRGLAAAVEEAVKRLGFGAADHPFSPHLTLARVKSPKGLDRLAEVLERHEADEFGTERVVAFRVMKSDLRPEGPLYTPLAEIPLATP